MNLFYEIVPLDTLFFRGNTPMEAGQSCAASLFPPPVSVIKGALRTAVLKQKDINVSEYKSGSTPDIEKLIGKPGEDAPFSVILIGIKKNSIYYVPAPALWYTDTKEKLKTGTDYEGKKLIAAEDYSTLFMNLGILSSEKNAYFVVPEHDAQPMMNTWVSTDILLNDKSVFARHDVLLSGDIYSIENRTGIERSDAGTIKKGKLYSASHIRLHSDVSIIIGINADIGLQDKGIIRLGGEMRISSYSKYDKNPFSEIKENTLYVSAAPIAAGVYSPEKLVASRKCITTSGWNMAKGFHKPSINWIPAGAVFNQKVHPACIPLAQKTIKNPVRK